MVNKIVPIPGYIHLYRSLLRFCDRPSAELKEMLYLLNTANLDSYSFYHPDAQITESGPVAFCRWLDRRYARPYRTEVQLYKAMLSYNAVLTGRLSLLHSGRRYKCCAV